MTLRRKRKPKPRRGPMRRPEQEAGAALIRWIDYLVLPDGTKPGQYFAHTPNGGARTAVEGAILKGQGVRPGWPDYTLYLPRGAFHGAVLELKAEGGSKERLQTSGYAALIAWGFPEAKQALKSYLQLPPWEGK